MRRTNNFFIAAAALTLGAMATGCEIFAEVDRSQIDNTIDAGDSTSSSSSSSSSGVAGAGGTGGTGGMAGAGGTAGTGGMGGGGGAGGGMPCQTPTDCPATPNECVIATCNGNVCGTSFAAAGTPTTMGQTDKDCKVDQCDGAGKIETVNDDTDVPVDNNDCTNDACTNGMPSNPPLMMGATCGAGAGLVCDGMGNCIGCNQPTDCSGNDTECQTRTCTGGMCGFSFTAQGTVLQAQTMNDCKTAICDGMGNVSNTFNGTDLPADDGNACTMAACDMAQGPVQNPVPTTDNNSCTTDSCNPMTGVSHAPVATGTMCMDGGGSVCNATGTCVQCNVAMDCSGMDTVCQTRTCTSAMCGFDYAAMGTVASNPTVGDCRSDQCNGMGGVTTGVVDNNDVPVDDGNQCTGEVCTAGVPSHPNLPTGTGCNQGGGTQCDGNGMCVPAPQCMMASECPGMDTECQTRTCTGGVCGFNYQPNGTAVTMGQTTGDCQVMQCNGMGVIVSVPDNADVPADDGNQCTNDTCSAGMPVHPPKPINTTCTSGGGAFCNATGQCVQCNMASQCGADTACQTRTCNMNMCGTNNAPNGTVVANPVTGDCRSSQCDGMGNINTNAVDNTDIPIDMNQCTDDVCTAGTPTNPPSAPRTTCSQGGTLCDGAGSCVQCLASADCPGMDTFCQTRACSMGSCGFNNTPVGTPTPMQTMGDCQQNQCDGMGGTQTVNYDPDVFDDGNECTADTCSMGMPSNTPTSAGTACTMGGTTCDGNGNCVTPMVPSVVSTLPDDNTMPDASSAIAVTFSTPMDFATLTGQTSAGACTGSIQVSFDNFTSCIAFSSSMAASSGGGTIATLTPAPGMLINHNHKIRVTTAAMSAVGVPLAAQYTQMNGFTTRSPNICNGSVVISQVFGGGGSGATVPNADYVGLHNRGTTAVTMTNWSLQYASSQGTSWSVATINGTIPAGGFFLVRMQSPQAVGIALPTPDVSGTNFNISATQGKLALVNNNTSLNPASCPTGASIVDFVGYGVGGASPPNCFEGAAGAVALNSSTAGFRNGTDCADVGDNSLDFTTGTPNPRNSMTPAAVCSCYVENEGGLGLEADYCAVIAQPSPFMVQTAMMTPVISGQLYEPGVTDQMMAGTLVRAQLGYGSATENPQYQTGWKWFNATYTGQGGTGNNDDIYGASFTAPVAGSYRYVYRFSLDQGVHWTVCDGNVGDLGAGSNPNLEFHFIDMPTMTVTP